MDRGFGVTSGSEAGSYVRLISASLNFRLESNEEEEEVTRFRGGWGGRIEMMLEGSGIWFRLWGCFRCSNRIRGGWCGRVQEWRGPAVERIWHT
jgi:hypothetical protein